MAEILFPAGCVLLFGKMSGPGIETVRRFAEAGSDLAVTYPEIPDQETWREVQSFGRKASFHCMNAGVPGEAEAVIDQVMAVHGRVHTVVWCVNDMASERAERPGLQDDWIPQLVGNSRGFFNAVEAVLPHFRAAGGGSLVVLLCRKDTGSPPLSGDEAAYADISCRMVPCLIRDESRYGVRANSVVADLSGRAGSTAEQGTPSGEPDLPSLGPKSGHFDWVQGMAHAAVFLASNKAVQVTGQHIRVRSHLPRP